MTETDGLSNWLEIDLGAIANNVKRMCEIGGIALMAVVKGNGYGQGLMAVGRQALAAGAAHYGVAQVDEALELRQAGLGGPVHVLGKTPASRLARRHRGYRTDR
jgi:alanine racemase